MKATGREDKWFFHDHFYLLLEGKTTEMYHREYKKNTKTEVRKNGDKKHRLLKSMIKDN